MKKPFCLILSAALLLLSLSACQGPWLSKERYTGSFYELFDTVSTVVAYDDSQAAFDEHLSQLEAELQKYDQLYDIYHTYDGLTNLCTVNAAAAQAPVKVDEKIMALLVFAKEAYTLTEGNTNVAFGAVLQLWHAAREAADADPDTAYLPDAAALTAAAAHTDINDLVLDEAASTVYFADPLLQLDVGAVAKGFAVREVCRWAAENLWSAAAISIGGNVYTVGYKNDDGKTLWNVQLENPYQDGEPATETVHVANLAVVTSAENQRYYTVDGKRYCHIINPSTLFPSEYTASVSVICEDSAVADALSTALFNLPIEEGKALVERLDGVEALWQTQEHTVETTGGFEQYQ
ncbi:MAG: FAD:protein FMN transferase [Eubacterium sp.]|nr:FAD:protein FMN transferase [Eubacterium sp.]